MCYSRGMVRLRRWDLDALNRRFGPWLSLAMGIGTLLLVRRGTEFAPIALAILLLGWGLAALLGLLFPAFSEPLPAGSPSGGAAGAAGAAEAGGVAGAAGLPRRRRLLRALLATVSVGLYQNVLFFLLPLWFGSATWRSANIVFPSLLAGMALFSCFEHPCRRWVLERPAVRALFSSLVLFATLVPAATVVTFAPVRAYISVAAGLAALPALLAVVPSRTRRSGRAVLLGAGALLGAGLAALLTPFFPPIPVQGVISGIGTGLDANLRLTGATDEVPAGTPRVHAWFSVAAPLRYRQAVVFEWYREGRHMRTFRASVVGGRRGGYRTWDWITVRRPGSWQVDLLTDSGGLIGREHFRVVAAAKQR
ncbi:MAG: DUF2914 domain-containing protein [Deltaproteobacteria bacterium]|nr:DUF2914 domain-containing protein [Deltaproteobacteria bacterium]